VTESAAIKRKRSKRAQQDKSTRIDVRVTPEEKAAISESARSLGLSVSEFLLLSSSHQPENLDDILRKARPVDRADPTLVMALARTNILLSELRNDLADSSPEKSVSQTAILTTLLSIHRMLVRLEP